MVIYKFENIFTGEVVYYKKKSTFCDRYEVNYRNLSLTSPEYKQYYESLTDKEKETKNRPRNHSKGWKQSKVEINENNPNIIIEDMYFDELSVLEKENIRLKKDIQRYRDKIRILQNEIKQVNRKENDFEEILKELLDKVDKQEKIKIEHNTSINNDNIGIIQLSDLHFNKVVKLAENKFNFDVAQKRLTKLFRKAQTIFDMNNIKKVAIIFTGDLFNLDKYNNKITNEGTRAEGFYKGWNIMRTLLDEMYSKYELMFAGVVGNESRIDDEFPISDSLAINNFDWLLYQFIKERYSDCIFLNDNNKIEDVISINNKNIHISHGYFLKQIFSGSKLKNKLESLNDIRVRWLLKKNIKIDYFLFGHIHSPLITDEFGRSGSLVGADDYSSNKLNIVSSKSSQNIYIVSKNNIYGLIIPLEEV